MAFSFVGRRRELEACSEWLAQSSQGRGRLVALAGEAGMGKTRLMDEFARSAAARGHTVAWSQMIEDPVAPPYLPWTLALRSIAQQFNDEALRNVLGSGATDVASLLPEIEDRLGIAASTAPADAAVARFRLFDSITRFLLGVARRKPLILLFDNLHLADRSTLQLLEYHCRQITASATLIVIAYRVSDVDEAHPLHAALSRIARTVGFENIELHGLTRAEVARLLHAGSGRPADPSFVDRLVERSDGNPLYVCEVASELRRAASETTTGPAAHEFRLPDSLREVIAARIDALPADTVQLLRTAAVLGRDFDLALLSAVAHGELESIDATLEAARSTGVTVALDAMRCRFTHALFRELLYEQSSRAQRTALHRAAAVALERRLGQGDD
ncbi:MAG TPA: AAA family ATPase, partial [Steroidobacteraceae bacterium]|nr:AAA family ATPase [Steroidobacteraceae bacterium]